MEVTERLEQLRQEYEKGQRQLELVDEQRQRLLATLLRIDGAIQVLEELTGEQAEVKEIRASTG